MKHITTILLILGVTFFVGCKTRVRSISQTGYHQNYQPPGEHSIELDEFDVLGVNRNQTVTEEEILEASRRSKTVQVSKGSTILLVQSGAIFPDGGMVAELSEHFRVVPFTGLTVQRTNRPATVVPMSSLVKNTYHTAAPMKESGQYSRMLRLAAARAGADAVVCYWGILESGTEELATKTVSWIPILNWVVADERQHMRMRLKIAVVDVVTGDWSVISTTSKDTHALSVQPRREVADQRQIVKLKQQAYETAVEEFVKVFAKR